MLSLQIETVTTCNARCHFCVYPSVHDTRSGKTMDMQLFRKIIDEAAEYPHRFHEVVLTGLSETLLDRHLVERVKYVRSKLPEHRIWLFTNGVFMTPGRFAELQLAGLSRITFSLNAVSAEQHEKVMGLKGKFDVIVQNIEYAIAHRSKMEILVDAVCDGVQFGIEDMCKFYFKWGRAVSYKPEMDSGSPNQHNTYGLVVMQGNWAGDRDMHPDYCIRPNEWCSRSTGQIYIMADGRISTCCFDPTGKQVFGDLNTQRLDEIYAGEKYAQFREDHVNDRADKYAICATCTRI